MQPTDITPNYTEPSNRKHRLAIIGIVVLAILVMLVVGATYAVNYFVEDRVITLEPKPGYTISIGPPTNNEDGLDISRLIAKATSFKRLRLKKGYYVVLFAGNSDYASVYQNLHVTNNMDLVSPSLDYTTQKLGLLLMQESPAIHPAFQASGSGSLLSQGYTIQDIGLYHDGSWYVGRLMPSNTGQDDILVFIMHQQNGQWELVANPAITLYIGDYPSIPSDVIRTANNTPL